MALSSMRCQVISYVVPDGPPYYANGPVRAMSKCETHLWIADPLAFIDGLCPLGRIELACDEAIAAIKEARKNT